MRSSLTRSPSLDVVLSKLLTRGVKNFILAGRKAFVSNARLHGNLPNLNFIIIYEAHRILGNSLTQVPFTPITCFLSPYNMV